MTRLIAEINRQELEHSARTAVAAVASILLARAIKLPEYYWAPITSFVVMQSTLGAALQVSRDRLVGTALGVVLGALMAPRFGANVIAFGICVLGLGLLCALLRVGRSAYRFSGITLAIVMLIPRDKPTWLVAIDRFIEVAIGICVGLLITAVWPESEPAVSEGAKTKAT